MKTMKRFLVSIFIICFGFSLKAQQGYTEIDLTKVSMQLPGPSIFAMAFDDSNNVWLSGGNSKFPASFTGSGLQKWDGKNLQQITSSFIQSNTPILSLLNAAGKMWVGTSLGLFSYNPKASQNTAWKQYDSIAGVINAIKSKNDKLYIAVDYNYYIYDLTSGLLQIFNVPINNAGPYRRVYDIEIGDNDDVWLATSDGVFKHSNGTFIQFNTNNSGLKINSVNTISWNPVAKELWIGTSYLANGINVGYTGLYRLKNGIIQSYEEINPCFLSLVYKFNNVWSIKTDNTGNVFVNGPNNASGGGYTILKITPQGAKGYLLSQTYVNIQKPVLTSSSYISALGFDNNNKLWLTGNLTGKLFRIDDWANIPHIVTDDFGKTGDNPERLYINNVEATMLNKGDMFWDGITNKGYMVPKKSCKSPISASALWIGGKDAKSVIHLAAMTNRVSGSDYTSGPLDTITKRGDSLGLFNKIWKISNWEIEEYKMKFADGSLANGSYTPPADFISWPAHGKANYSYNLAPYVDIDNNGKYEPLKGDYPKIKGEQALYWIFNDNTNVHAETHGVPLGVEVQAMAYAYNCDSIATGSHNEALNYTTFYEYKIINRTDTIYDSVYYSMWADAGLGNYLDDYIGCSPQGNFGFVYNSDNEDEGTAGYGINPPMLSVVFLSDSMTNFMGYKSDYSVTGIPSYYGLYYNYMRSVWKDGTPLKYGGDGYKSGTATKHFLSGVPYKAGEWNEAEVGNQPGSRHFVQSTGPYDFKPGEVKTFSYAIVYSHEPNQPNGLTTSWVKNLNDVNAVKNWYKNQTFPTCPTKPEGLSVQENTLQANAVKLYPNPTNGNATIEFTILENSIVSFEVYNVLGQKVYVFQRELSSGSQTLTADLSSQPAGIYIYVLKSGNSRVSDKIIKNE
jgi:hypothetical protein